MFAVTAGASNPVDKVFGDFRQVVINDVSDVLHVNSARGNVRRHQYPEAALLKPSQSSAALRLRAVAMNHRGANALLIQILGDALGAALGARKYQASAEFFGKQLMERILLAVDGHFKRLQSHIFRRL